MKKKRYTVMLDDNFHYMDEEHRYKYGEFSTYEKAVAACKKIVDEELRDMLKQGVKPEELSSTWSLYGSDPFIIGGSRRFSARDYVTEKTQESSGSKQETCQEVRVSTGSSGSESGTKSWSDRDPKIDENGDLTLSGFLGNDEYLVVVNKKHHKKLLRALVEREFGFHKRSWRTLFHSILQEPFFRTVFEDRPIDTQSYRHFLTSKAIPIEDERQLVGEAHQNTLLLALVELAFEPNARAYADYVGFLDQTGIRYEVLWP